MSTTIPWVTFCISTFARPEMLEIQLKLLLQQSFRGFEIVVSDNDPNASAREVTERLGDPRIRYYCNGENLGMIRSFNKSIERSSTDYVVMVTDDDPVQPDFLKDFYSLAQQYPGYSLYAGCILNHDENGFIRVVESNEVIPELLDPEKVKNMLWSSAIVNREDAIRIGCIPDFGSPHLADHAFLAIVGAERGCVLVNKMYSTLSKHDKNFSKFNFNYYVAGCSGFHNLMERLADNRKDPRIVSIATQHLHVWFIACMSSLKRYYTVNRKKDEVNKVELCAQEILSLPYMKTVSFKWKIKNSIFQLKKILGLIK